MLAELAVATAAFSTVKNFVMEGRELYDMGEKLYDYFDAKNSLQKKVNQNTKSDKSDLEEFLALEKIKAQEEELKQLMIYTGRAGMWQDWIKFQADASERRKAAEKERLKKKMQFQQQLYQYFEIGAAVIFGGVLLIGGIWFFLKIFGT